MANGDQVAVTTRSGGAPEGTLDVRCDVTDPAAVEAAFAEIEAAHGPVEVLVANAGITADTLVLRMSEDDWAKVIDTNLTGSFRLAKRAAKTLRHVDGFEVTQVRGQVKDGAVEHFQVGIEVGFRLEDD